MPRLPQHGDHLLPHRSGLFPVFLRELAQAKEYIFLEYFIIAEGSMWSDVLDILTEKAAAGVEVG